MVCTAPAEDMSNGLIGLAGRLRLASDPTYYANSLCVSKVKILISMTFPDDLLRGMRF